jgi:toxin ParE1/3/4
VARVIWTKRAAEQLDGIVNYIAADSPRNAARFEEGALWATRRLILFPYAGGIVEELRSLDVREILFGSYRILYRVQGETCYIVCMFHGSRELRSAFDPRRDLPDVP